MESLPAVDFSSPDIKGTASRIVHIMETVGFLYLDNVPDYNVQVEEELLEAHKWFFSFPLEKKMRVARYLYNKQNGNFYRGYFGLDKDYSSYKEGYEFGQDSFTWDDYQPNNSDEGFPMTEENVWPQPDPNDSQEERDKYIKFKETVGNHFKRMMSAALKFLQLIAIGLGLPENYFYHLFVPETLSTLRLLHYPQRDFETPAVAIENGQVVVCETHIDSGFVTLLTTFDFTGLQVLLQDNSYLNVEPRPGSLVVNLGRLLSEITGGRIKATKHRVIDPGGERYSLPFFVEPGFFAMVPLSVPLRGEGEENRERGMGGNEEVKEAVEYMQFGPWLIQSMKKFAENGDILKIVEESGYYKNRK